MTIQREWRPYLRDRLISEDPEGFFVIVPEGVELAIPLACDTCKRLYRSRDDESSHREFGCCYLCALQWAHSRRKEWNDGWRPSQDEVEEATKQRPDLYVVFDVD